MLSGARRVVMLLAVMMFTMTAQTAWADGTLTGEGTSSAPYQIGTADDWNTFAGWINAGTNADKYYKLTADISVTTMVGNIDNKFKGTFDGGGHTLTVTYNVTESRVAPFRYVQDVTIKNLHVAGTITTSNKYASGLISFTYGNCTINNCWSSVTINSSYNGNCYHSGFIGDAMYLSEKSSSTTFNNCLFDGKLLNNTSNTTLSQVGGFVGYRDNGNDVHFSGCYYNPSEVTFQGGSTFCLNGLNSIEHSYYSTSLGDGQGGTAVGEMTAAQLAEALNNGLPNWQVDGSGNVVPIMVPNPHDLRYATVDGLKSVYQCDAENPAEITFTVTDIADITLAKGTHYTVTLDGTDVTNQTPITTSTLGAHTLTITGKAPYKESRTFNFTVSDLNTITASTIPTQMTGVYKVTENIVTDNRLVVNGEVTLILGAGKTLTANKGIEVTVGNTLTIKGEGTLTATAQDYYAAIGNNYGNSQTREYGHIIIESGTINATGGHNAAGIGGGYGNRDNGNSIIEIKGGIVNATGGTCAAGIGAGQCSESGVSYYGKPGQIFITGGQVTARGGGNTSEKGSGIGGGQKFGEKGRTGTLTLGWTNETDFIDSDGIWGFTNSDNTKNISFVGDKRFRLNATNTLVTSSNLTGGYLVPADEHDIALCNLKTKKLYSLYTGTNTTIPCTVTTFLGNVLTEGVDYEVKYKKTGSDVEIDKISEKDQQYHVIVRGISPYFGEQTSNYIIVRDPAVIAGDMGQEPKLYDFVYVVTNDATVNNHIEVVGDSKLILNEGTTLTAKNGICVPDGCSLTIEGKGTLVSESPNDNQAGIGGALGFSIYKHGDIIINGGHIIAKGGKYAAGIGGGANSVKGGKIIINGGVVEATGGENAAGIGGGYYLTYNDPWDGMPGDITINGGQVTAKAGSGASAIGKAKESTGTDSKLTIAMIGPDDFLKAGSYGVDEIDFDGKSFILEEEGYPAATATNMAGKKVRPASWLNPVSYIDENGAAQSHTAAVIDGSQTNLPGGWYVVNSNVALTTKLIFTGDAYLILADGKTLSIDASNDSGEGNSYFGLLCKDNMIGNNPTYHDLTIYGQAAGTGKVTSNNGDHGSAWSYDYYAENITINGGVVEATGTQQGVQARGNLTINGGQVISTNATISGNHVTLGWRNPADYIQANEINCSSGGSITIADDKVFTDGTSLYLDTTPTATLDALQNVTLRPFTCVALTTDGSGNITATFDGSTLEETFSIPCDLAVNDVQFNRTFNEDKKTCICWPFAVSQEKANALGKFYQFTGVTGEGKIEMTQVTMGGLEANKPYIFEPGSDLTAIDFGAQTLKTGGAASVGSDFTFKGIYDRVKWTTDNTDPLYDATYEAELGKAYGFALEDLAGYSVGQFVKLGSGAHSRPFRAYLLYDGAWDGNQPSAGARRRSESVELPAVLDIVWISGSDQSTGIDRIATSRETDEWYSLDGRKLSDKPVTKGLYIHNGNKVAIK